MNWMILCFEAFNLFLWSITYFTSKHQIQLALKQAGDKCVKLLLSSWIACVEWRIDKPYLDAWGSLACSEIIKTMVNKKAAPFQGLFSASFMTAGWFKHCRLLTVFITFMKLFWVVWPEAEDWFIDVFYFFFSSGSETLKHFLKGRTLLWLSLVDLKHKYNWKNKQIHTSAHNFLLTIL